MKNYYNESTGGRYTPSIFICQFVSLSVRQLEEASTFDLYTFFHADKKGEEGRKKRLIKK